MTEEYVYSGECEPTICPCNAIHPWDYELEIAANGQEGCYECLKDCELCTARVFEVFKCDGFKLCAGCKAGWAVVDEDVIWELAA
jgi:hypothetical protein